MLTVRWMSEDEEMIKETSMKVGLPLLKYDVGWNWGQGREGPSSEILNR